MLREGVDRFPNVEVLLEHECLRVVHEGRPRRADAGRPAHRHVQAVARLLRDRRRRRLVTTRGQLGVGLQRDAPTPSAGSSSTPRCSRSGTGHDRLRFHCNPARPTVDCPTPLGHHRWEFPVRAGEDERELLTEEAIWKVLATRASPKKT